MQYHVCHVNDKDLVLKVFNERAADTAFPARFV
jgi:hypothetical protein